MEQIQLERKDREHPENAPETEAKDLRDEKFFEDIDAMLDEIDDVLEENAEAFVRGYIQRGGE